VPVATTALWVPGRTFAAGCLFNELCLPRACEAGFLPALLEMALCVIPVNNSWSVHRLWSGDITGGEPHAGFAQGFCPTKQLCAIPRLRACSGQRGDGPLHGGGEVRGADHRRRSLGCRRPKGPLQWQSRWLYRALRDVAAC